jgi:hypothetical protein
MKKPDDALMKRARSLQRADEAPEEMLPDYIERARELMAIEANQGTAAIPVQEANKRLDSQPYGEPIEPIEAVRNQGEFPTLIDEGEQLAPDKKNLEGEPSAKTGDA